MDIEQFIKSIGYSNFESAVVTFFDENMALYNLVGEYTDLQINGEVQGSSIKFNLNFKSKKDAKKMNELISDRILVVFDRRFIVNGTLNGSSITVEFS